MYTWLAVEKLWVEVQIEAVPLHILSRVVGCVLFVGVGFVRVESPTKLKLSVFCYKNDLNAKGEKEGLF